MCGVPFASAEGAREIIPAATDAGPASVGARLTAGAAACSAIGGGSTVGRNIFGGCTLIVALAKTGDCCGAGTVARKTAPRAPAPAAARAMGARRNSEEDFPLAPEKADWGRQMASLPFLQQVQRRALRSPALPQQSALLKARESAAPRRSRTQSRRQANPVARVRARFPIRSRAAEERKRGTAEEESGSARPLRAARLRPTSRAFPPGRLKSLATVPASAVPRRWERARGLRPGRATAPVARGWR